MKNETLYIQNYKEIKRNFRQPEALVDVSFLYPCCKNLFTKGNDRTLSGFFKIVSCALKYVDFFVNKKN